MAKSTEVHEIPFKERVKPPKMGKIRLSLNVNTFKLPILYKLVIG